MSTVGHDLGNDSSHMTVCDWSMDSRAYINHEAWSPDQLCRYTTTTLQSHVSKIKHLLGWKFSAPELQSELDFLPFRVIEGPNGYPLVHSKCMGEDRAFTPIEILAMLISYLESLASEEHRPLHCSNFPRCIGVPIHFTDQQKKDVLAAGKVAGLPSLNLLDETVAMVLGYENSWHSAGTGISAFVDIGYDSMQVCFAQFEAHGPASGHDRTVCTKILYQAYVRSLGERDFNKVLFTHFASIIQKKYSVNVYQSADTCFDLSDACEGLRKELSKFDMASFCIKKFSGTKDIKGSITRNQFENISAPILKRIKDELGKALVNSGLDRYMVQSVKLVANGCSMPAINNILKEVFGIEIRKMTNSDEYIARGTAISHVPWIRSRRTRLAIDVPTSELTMIESPFRAKKDGNSEMFLWRKAMDKNGASLSFINKFLEMNISRIGRSKKTEEESFWISKAQSPKQKIAIMDRARMLNDKSYWFWKAQSPQKRDDRTLYTTDTEKTLNDLDDENEKRRVLQFQLLEAQKLIKQLTSERDNARKEVEELRQLTEQQAPCTKCVKYFDAYSYSELQEATNNFHDSFKLGEGGFGIVYKGILHKTTVAIKILKGGSSEGAKELLHEIEILSKVRHPNLVTLIGACAENRALIYEYLPNGSLEDHLMCKNNTLPLSWQTRVCIAFEICSALSFLHCSKPHGIVHGDLKPDNILLDLNNVSKISDFGLCRELNWTDSASVPYQWTDCLKGTLVYMDPEYFSSGMITPQYDVYSFGIILLRLTTCKNPRGIRNLVEEARNKGALKMLVDASAGPWPLKEAAKMISLGLRCSDPTRRNRPDLSNQVWMELKSMAEVAFASASL